MSLNVETQSSHSLASSVTHKDKTEKHAKLDLPEEKLEVALEKLKEDDWENDPDNARNWSSAKKWTATAIVITPSLLYTSCFSNNFFFSPFS
jgi:hypothetical protein